jgi:transcriptional regulator with XRE-family HTH domain
LHPGETFVQPTVGFHVRSVHSIREIVAMTESSNLEMMFKIMHAVTNLVKQVGMSKTSMLALDSVKLGSMAAKDIVSLARNCAGFSQEDFGREIGKSQSVVSKYEKGLADPPAGVISHCVNILMGAKGAPSTSLDQLISRLRQTESLPTAPYLYSAIDAVIDAFSVGARLSPGKAEPA